MTFTFLITITLILAFLFIVALLAGEESGGLIGLTFMLNTVWLIFGLMLGSHININPEYPPVYNNVKVVGVVDIPNKGFLLVTENGKQEVFSSISSLPLHDVKVLVYENYFDTWKNPLTPTINVTKTLEENKK